MSQVKQGSDEPGENAAQKEKAGASSRFPNTVFYRNNYSTNYRIVKGNFQEILGGLEVPEPPWPSIPAKPSGPPTPARSAANSSASINS